MKKILIIIISVILICLTGLGIIGYYIEKDKEAEKINIKAELKSDQADEKEKIEFDINKLDIKKIEGYVPGESIENKDYTPNTTIDGINIPYSIPYKNMEIVSVGKYSGKFIEDGSDVNKDNVLSIIVKNTSKEVIDYGEIIMKIIGKDETIKFKITNLKPGACTLVMESSGNIKFNSDDKYIYLDSKNNMVDNLSTMESQIAITTENKKITIKNLSDKNLNTVYVYYKTVSPGNCYLGGITYRAKFEKVGPGKSVSVNTIHFSDKNSEILKVESLNK